ncbi:MAG: HupE/UreJ family protein [bacterium]|nr:HupE/UreJ family protein [bacterium]
MGMIWTVVDKFKQISRVSTAIFLLTPVFLIASARADVVKPALIEISADVTGVVRIEVRASIEALLTGINGRYKNTKQSPNGAQYDALRVLSGVQLREKFKPFESSFLGEIFLKADGVRVPLQISSVTIPAPGYTKVPRPSIIILEGPLSRATQKLQFYYPARFGQSAVRVRQVDEKAAKWYWSQWQWIRTDEPSQMFSLSELFTKRPVLEVIWSYIKLGYVHILPKGLDHILFILGLFLFSPNLRPLLWQVTMFTLAHTLTLGLSMAGLFSLPSRIVEPLIAASIAYVGFENIRSKSLGNARLALVFAFGLLHGLGFASVLADFGMERDAFVTSLISFNMGVEFGQLTILAICFALTGFWFGQKSWYRNFVTIPASLLITLIALYWMVERLELI